MKIQSLKELETGMRAVARGEIPAPPDAHLPSGESTEALPQRRRDQSAAARKARVARSVAEIAAMPILDERSPREIMDDINEL